MFEIPNRKNNVFFVKCWFVYRRLSRTYPSSREPDELGVAGGDRTEEDRPSYVAGTHTDPPEVLFFPAREQVATQILEGIRFDSVIAFNRKRKRYIIHSGPS